MSPTLPRLSLGNTTLASDEKPARPELRDHLSALGAMKQVTPCSHEQRQRAQHQRQRKDDLEIGPTGSERRRRRLNNAHARQHIDVQIVRELLIDGAFAMQFHTRARLIHIEQQALIFSLFERQSTELLVQLPHVVRLAFRQGAQTREIGIQFYQRRDRVLVHAHQQQWRIAG